MKVPGFGKRPAFLDAINAALAAEREYVLDVMNAAQREARSSSSEHHLREMGDDERAELINQLKNKFTEVNHVSYRQATRGAQASPSAKREAETKPPVMRKRALLIEPLLALCSRGASRLALPSPPSPPP